MCIYGPLYNEFTAVTKNLLIINSRKKVSYCNLIHNEKSRIFNNLLKNQFYFPSIVNTLCGGLKESFIKKIAKKESEKKIRIGYYSADYYEHATSYLMVELIELHDKSKFEIFGFSFSPKKDD